MTYSCPSHTPFLYTSNNAEGYALRRNGRCKIWLLLAVGEDGAVDSHGCTPSNAHMRVDAACYIYVITFLFHGRLGAAKTAEGSHTMSVEDGMGISGRERINMEITPDE